MRITIAVGIIVCIMLLVALEYHATRPRTHREAVMQILDQRAIPYRDVRVTKACSFDPRDCAVMSAYTAYVEVVGVPPVHGRIVCQHQIASGDGDGCTLSLAALDIHNVPLPALARDPSWLPALQRQLQYIARWLRTWIQSR